MSEIPMTPEASRARAQMLRDEAAGVPAWQTDRMERLLRAADRFDSLARRLEWDHERRAGRGDA
jgi:hypothetical protein